MKRCYFLVCASMLLGCAKGDDCAAIQQIGGLFGSGAQPMVDETNAGTRLWFWVDAPFPRLDPAKAKSDSPVLFTDPETKFELAGVNDADHILNQPIPVGIGANIAVDPARAMENYDTWTCTFRTSHSSPPGAAYQTTCPVLKTAGGSGAAEACKKVLLAGTTKRFQAAFANAAVSCSYGGPWLWGFASWPKGLEKPNYIRSVDDARVSFNALALKAGYPVTPGAIVARSIVDVVKDQLNSPGCYGGKGPRGRPPPPQGEVPPGAESTDAGGVAIPPETTPGDSSGSGDYP